MQNRVFETVRSELFISLPDNAGTGWVHSYSMYEFPFASDTPFIFIFIIKNQTNIEYSILTTKYNMSRVTVDKLTVKEINKSRKMNNFQIVNQFS